MEIINRSSCDSCYLIILVHLHLDEDRIYGEILNAVKVLLVCLMLKDMQAVVLQQQPANFMLVVVAISEADDGRSS